MITADHIKFQTPPNADHQWAETYWFGLYIPEENIYGWVYLVFRAGSGATTCDIEFIDRCSSEMFDARYIDIQHHLNIPADLQKFTLANGLQFEARSPREYRLDYVGVDDTELHLDVEGIHEPYDIHDPAIDPMARADRGQAIEHSGFGTAYAGHFDLTARVRGSISIRGKSYDVDCLATNDHSWGFRPERGMRPMGYVNAHFSEDYVVQSIWEFDPSKADGKQHIFKHGYVVREGKLVGGVAGTLSIVHRGIYPAALELSLTDEAGDTHRMSGTPSAYNVWVPYGCTPTAHAMVRWQHSTGIEGVGTSMEAFPLDTVTGDYLHEDIRLSSPTHGTGPGSTVLP
ncbi:hypothetical protein F8M49_20285 [Rhodococcus zopfii]|uniref:AttH domain-containing protein n=1 Tax=Rhodococcus zopfii TaxID=43772 RepID=A0ABU3WSW9_9NOCA|nr:hypothetical protein [Rhodococcus zopfii]